MRVTLAASRRGFLLLWGAASLLLWGAVSAGGAAADPAGGLLEVSLGKFTTLRLDHASPTEAVLQNIPINVSFVIFQIHTHYQNVTVSLSKVCPEWASWHGYIHPLPECDRLSQQGMS
ncbi:hypothetical protein FKM82_021806 [Ascaphus truei]